MKATGLVPAKPRLVAIAITEREGDATGDVGSLEPDADADETGRREGERESEAADIVDVGGR